MTFGLSTCPGPAHRQGDRSSSWAPAVPAATAADATGRRADRRRCRFDVSCLPRGSASGRRRTVLAATITDPPVRTGTRHAMIGAMAGTSASDGPRRHRRRSRSIEELDVARRRPIVGGRRQASHPAAPSPARVREPPVRRSTSRRVAAAAAAHRGSRARHVAAHRRPTARHVAFLRCDPLDDDAPTELSRDRGSAGRVRGCWRPRGRAGLRRHQ